MRKARAGVLVSDFDGTMTRHDFYRLALDSLIPSDCPDYWSAFERGELTHFEALQAYFRSITASDDEVLSALDRMGLDPDLATSVALLREAGWEVVVTSAGCEWYIQRLLNGAGVSLEVHANPGTFEAGSGLQMRLPVDSPYLSHTLGVDKAKIVEDLLSSEVRVAFAGDSDPDADPARLVDSDMRFARGELAELFRHEGLPFREFNTWSEVVQTLLRQTP